LVPREKSKPTGRGRENPYSMGKRRKNEYKSPEQERKKKAIP